MFDCYYLWLVGAMNVQARICAQSLGLSIKHDINSQFTKERAETGKRGKKAKADGVA